MSAVVFAMGQWHLLANWFNFRCRFCRPCVVHMSRLILPARSTLGSWFIWLWSCLLKLDFRPPPCFLDFDILRFTALLCMPAMGISVPSIFACLVAVFGRMARRSWRSRFRFWRLGVELSQRILRFLACATYAKFSSFPRIVPGLHLRLGALCHLRRWLRIHPVLVAMCFLVFCFRALVMLAFSCLCSLSCLCFFVLLGGWCPFSVAFRP